MKTFFSLIAILFTLTVSDQSHAALTRAEFEQSLEAFQRVFQKHYKINEDDQLLLNNKGEEQEELWWELEDLRASYAKIEYDDYTQHYIVVFGGLARMEKMSIHSLGTTLCHEFGHGVGGPPFKSSGSSTEGQSDYFATSECLIHYLAEVPEFEADPSNGSLFCGEAPEERRDYCYKAFSLLDVEVDFLNLGSESLVELEAWDESVSDKVYTEPFYYPSAQCRLDTMKLGILGMPRPACWYNP